MIDLIKYEDSPIIKELHRLYENIEVFKRTKQKIHDKRLEADSLYLEVGESVLKIVVDLLEGRGIDHELKAEIGTQLELEFVRKEGEG